MTDQLVKYRVCDRCPNETLADETHKITLDGHKYEIDLCKPHALRLEVTLGEWTEAGTKTGEPTVFDKVRPLIKPPVVTRKQMPAEAPEVVHVGPMIADFGDRWLVTEHARLRMGQRDVSLADALYCAELPEARLPSAKTDGYWEHRRGDVGVIVHGQKIITVYRYEEKAQAHGG
jgi:hypothetical protein